MRSANVTKTADAGGAGALEQRVSRILQDAKRLAELQALHDADEMDAFSVGDKRVLDLEATIDDAEEELVFAIRQLSDEHLAHLKGAWGGQSESGDSAPIQPAGNVTRESVALAFALLLGALTSPEGDSLKDRLAQAMKLARWWELPPTIQNLVWMWVECFSHRTQVQRDLGAETLARVAQWAGLEDQVAYSTSEGIADVMVWLLDPREDGTVYNPGAGSGVLLDTLRSRVRQATKRARAQASRESHRRMMASFGSWRAKREEDRQAETTTECRRIDRDFVWLPPHALAAAKRVATRGRNATRAKTRVGESEAVEEARDTGQEALVAEPKDTPIDASRSPDRDPPPPSSPGEADPPAPVIVGVERALVPFAMAKALAAMNALPSQPRLFHGDALEFSPQDLGAPEGFDYVVADPPWGRIDTSSAHQLPMATHEASMQFLQHVMAALKPGGRAVIALPERVLHGPGPNREVRRALLTEHDVEGVIQVGGTRSSLTPVRTNLVVFRRAAPRPKVRFMSIADKSGMSPSEIVSEFRGHRDSPHRWEIPVSVLEERDWMLLPRRTGARALDSTLRQLIDADPDIAIRPLGEVANLRPGKPVKSSGTGTIEAQSDKSIGVVRPAEVTDDGVHPPVRFLTEDAMASISPEDPLRAGDVLVTTMGEVGRVGVTDEALAGAVAGRGVAAIRPGPGLDSIFLAKVLCSDLYQAWLQGHAFGAVPRLAVVKLRDLSVPVPSLQRQARIVHGISASVRDRWVGYDALKAVREPRGRYEMAPLAGRGEPFAAIARILTSVDNPVVRWLEESPEVREMRDPGDVEDGVGLLERLAASVQELTRRVTEGESKRQPELARWLETLASSVAVFEDLGDLPGAEALATLSGALPAIRSVSAKTTGPASKHAATLADETTHGVLRVAEAARRRLLGSVNVEADILYVRVGKPVDDGRGYPEIAGEPVLRFRNRSPLSLRRLELSTRPAVGEARATRLAPDSSVSVPLQIPDDAATGPYPFTLDWRATLLDGTRRGDSVGLIAVASATTPSGKATELGPSPYVVGSPVERRDMLFGRQPIIDEIRRQLPTTGQPNVVLLQGNRRTGKTSILKRLQATDVLPGWIPVYCSLQSGDGHDRERGLPTNEVFRLMAVEVGLAAFGADLRVLPEVDPPVGPGRSRLAFRRALRESTKRAFTGRHPFEAFRLYLESVMEATRPRRLLLMLDEFDKLQEGIDCGVTSPMVPENIRYLLHTYSDLSAILAGSLRLKQLAQEYWSALFGLGHRVTVGELRTDDARQLVTQPVAGSLRYVDEARNQIVDLCARQPYLIQSLCNRIFGNAARSGHGTIATHHVHRAAKAMAKDHQHFRILWQYAGNERRRLLLALCHELQGRVPVTSKLLERQLREHRVGLGEGERVSRDLELLCDLEILQYSGIKKGSAYGVAVPLMGMWIDRNIDLDRQRERAADEFEKEDRGWSCPARTDTFSFGSTRGGEPWRERGGGVTRPR